MKLIPASSMTGGIILRLCCCSQIPNFPVYASLTARASLVCGETRDFQAIDVCVMALGNKAIVIRRLKWSKLTH